jgi:hypothetical protein
MAKDDDWVYDPPPQQSPDRIVRPPYEAGALDRFKTVDDAIRAGANAFTFGLADRGAGAGDVLIGRAPNYDAGVNAQVQLSKEARERSPYASIAGDVAGTAAIPSLGGGPAIAARLGGGVAARAAGYGLEGAGIGAAQGAGNTYSGDPSDYAKNAGMGAIFGGVSGAATGGLLGPRAPTSTVRPPTAAQLDREADTAYAALRAHPATYSAQHFADYADKVEQYLLNKGFIPDYSKGTWAALERMRQGAAQPGAVITPLNIDLTRQGLKNIPSGRMADVDRKSAQIVREALDHFMVSPPSGAVVPGTEHLAANAGKIANYARGNYAGARRAELMDNLQTRQEDITAGQHAGLNYGNVVRQQVASLINPMRKDDPLKGFAPSEVDALRAINRGTPTLNTARYIGNALGGGGGVAVPLISMAGTTAAGSYQSGGDPTTSGLAAAVPVAAGLGLRMGSNRAIRNAFQAVDAKVRERTPLHQGNVQAAGNPMAPGPAGLLSARGVEQARNALTLELLRQQQNQ